jgi:hypothetical protein
MSQSQDVLIMFRKGAESRRGSMTSFGGGGELPWGDCHLANPLGSISPNSLI